MLISYQKEFLFIHVGKTGGSSMRKVLAKYADNRLETLLVRLLNNLGRKVTSPCCLFKYKLFPIHSIAKMLAEELPEVYDKFYKFAFVRNPWDWQVSAYFYILKRQKHHLHSLIKQKQFDEYIEWMVNNPCLLQKQWITDESGKVIVDFVGKYENISEDFQHICRTLNIDVNLPHVNKSKHKDYREYYNERTMKLVEEKFKEDIELFGYTFDGCVAKTFN